MKKWSDWDFQIPQRSNRQKKTLLWSFYYFFMSPHRWSNNFSRWGHRVRSQGHSIHASGSPTMFFPPSQSQQASDHERIPSMLIHPLLLSLIWSPDSKGHRLSKKKPCVFSINHIYGRGEAYTVIPHDGLSLPLQCSPISFLPSPFFFLLKLVWRACAKACRYIHLIKQGVICVQYNRGYCVPLAVCTFAFVSSPQQPH